MYHINNNVFSCILKVVRLQSDIRNAVGKLFHTEGPETAHACSCVKPTAETHLLSLTIDKISTLYHEVLDDTVDWRSLVMERLLSDLTHTKFSYKHEVSE